MDAQASAPDAYLLFRLRGERRLRRLALPVTVGSDGMCDVVARTASGEALAYVLSAGPSGITVRAAKREAPVPVSALAPLGLHVLGQVGGGPAAKPKLTQRWREAMLREAAWFDSLRPKGRRLLGGRWRQGTRLRLWACGVAATAGLVALVLREPVYADRSQDIQPMVFAAPLAAIVGASPKRHGFERGARFTVEAPAGVEAQSTLLSFKTMALNRPGEVSFAVNGQPVYTSAVDTSCLETACDVQVPVPAGLVKAGTNAITLVHDAAGGSYMVHLLQLQPLPALTADDRLLAQRWMDLARRNYDERGIAPDNLVAARIHAGRALDLLARRAGTSELSAAGRVLKGEIDQAFQVAARDAWAEVELHERLGRKDETKRALGVLLRLFPDPEAPENQAAKAKLEALAEEVSL